MISFLGTHSGGKGLSEKTEKLSVQNFKECPMKYLTSNSPSFYNVYKVLLLYIRHK